MYMLDGVNCTTEKNSQEGWQAMQVGEVCNFKQGDQ